jgi:hypothetical protein
MCQFCPPPDYYEKAKNGEINFVPIDSPEGAVIFKRILAANGIDPDEDDRRQT